jgi:hypothetical protein
MRARGKKTRVVVNYMEKYHTREAGVTSGEARAVLEGASVIYAVEQGTITIPEYENQERMVCTLRFERIIAPPRADPPKERP